MELRQPLARFRKRIDWGRGIGDHLFWGDILLMEPTPLESDTTQILIEMSFGKWTLMDSFYEFAAEGLLPVRSPVCLTRTPLKTSA